MPFDAGFLYKTVEELKSAIDCHIDKIYQPSKDELVFLLRKKGFVKRLLITVKSGGARLHFTENKYENPATPPMFCMLIRKYLSSARLVDIVVPSLERVAVLIFSATNELGDKVILKLVCEFIGNQTNIILVNSDGKIIDALRHSDVETAQRFILPGADYQYPAATNKLNPLNTDLNVLADKILASNGEISKSVLSIVEGFSPLICREIEYLYNKESERNIDRKECIYNSLNEILKNLSDKANPTLILNEYNLPFDFSYTDINQYGNTFSKKQFKSCSELLDAFYTEKDNAYKIKTASQDITRLLNNLLSRTQKKLAIRLNELEKCKDRENLRIYGELIKANLHSIENGSKFAVVTNYYDENLAQIDIPLNPAYTPAKNADKYFKDYKKSYAAEQALTKLTRQDSQEIIYFESVLDSISRCNSISEINEIRDELVNQGYIKRHALKKKSNNTSTLDEYTSKEGYKIIVGKNNIQNDYITTKLSSKNDLWFHVKNIPGSHVVIFNGGKEVSEDTIIYAASLAALNSKAANSSNVPVDYVNIKFVKKPASAKPGMVIYTNNKTVFVTPKKEMKI